MKSSLFERSGMLLADALLGIALISSATIFYVTNQSWSRERINQTEQRLEHVRKCYEIEINHE
ncbi:hypothetical protein B808_1249 [Fructilactobacillus florum 8D]|uniref:Uncharacterized protein n=1 Tax=Fructilactobacillus florum 8D TaxID=1221538 RepID=W9ECT6_9LACO|nr:hypothetical protein [Fructilactobacillus florum]ETO39918.1 hypothetical protein B808_1249 [Fructilactobacillus florum 8D]